MPKRDKNGRWLKGESANPGGLKPGEREAKKTVRTIAQEILSETDNLKNKSGTPKYPDKTRLEALMTRLYEFAMAKGDMHAARLLLEYAYGKPNQIIEHEGLPGTEDQPLVIIMGNGKKTEVKPGAEGE